MEHDAVHMMDAVGQRAGQMVLRGADGTAIRYADVARDQARRGVFLPERSQALQRLDGIDGKLAQTGDVVFCYAKRLPDLNCLIVVSKDSKVQTIKR